MLKTRKKILHFGKWEVYSIPHFKGKCANFTHQRVLGTTAYAKHKLYEDFVAAKTVVKPFTKPREVHEGAKMCFGED